MDLAVFLWRALLAIGAALGWGALIWQLYVGFRDYARARRRDDVQRRVNQSMERWAYLSERRGL